MVDAGDAEASRDTGFEDASVEGAQAELMGKVGDMHGRCGPCQCMTPLEVEFWGSEEIIQLRMEVHSRDEALERLRADLTLREGALQAAAKARQDLEKVVAAKDAEQERLQRTNEALENSIQLVVAELSDGKARSAEVQHTVAESETRAQELEALVAQRDADVQQLKAQLKCALEQQEALIQRNRNQQRQHEQEYDTLHAKFQAEGRQLKEDAATQEGVLQQQTASLRALHETLESRSQALTSLQQDYSLQAQELEGARQRLAMQSETMQQQVQGVQAELRQELEHKILLLRNRDIELEALKQSHADTQQRNKSLDRLVADLQEDKAFWRHDAEVQAAQHDKKVRELTKRLERREQELTEAAYWLEQEKKEKTTIRQQFVDRLTEKEKELKQWKERYAEATTGPQTTEEMLKQQKAKEQAAVQELQACLSEMHHVRRIVEQAIKQQPDMAVLLGTDEQLQEAKQPPPPTSAVGIALLKQELYGLRGTLAQECAAMIATNGCAMQ